MNEKWDVINNLDLSRVNSKLRERKGFWWRWTHNVDKLEAEYRQFLYLAATNPTKTVVPWSEALDDFWHEHILDTVKYENECLAIFGKMFHHNPHLPVGSEEQKNAYKETKEMYKEAFEPKAKAAKSGASDSHDPGCGGGFIAVFCGGSCSCASASHSDGHGHSDCGDSGGHSDGGGHSCGGGDGGGSSCGGSSCGGGGGCGGGGD